MKIFRIGSVLLLGLFLYGTVDAADTAPPTPVFPTRDELKKSEPLLDWSDWEKFRGTIRHPAVAIKRADIERARSNIARYDWAKKYASSLTDGGHANLARLTPAFLEQMIPDTTPGDSLFTPCPACRDQKKPYLAHGDWSWSDAKPDELKCKVCGTVFPNAQYPESIELHTTWGHPQTLTFYGGEPFEIFSYKTGRPSFTGNIRARKVEWMSSLVSRLGEAYALTGDIEYAQGVRKILLRFAEVYPYWLVHSGYGDYADMDPHVAAVRINNLPADELVTPPTKPDRVIHTGYWSAGRAWALGMEGTFVRRVTQAYDFTADAKDAAGQPLYSEDEKKKIERDLLLESTVLMVADKGLNNKSVGNSTAAAAVGICVGHPGLVHFGHDFFLKTVNDWFLPDGTTSESAAYANMTLGGIWELGQSLNGYSDPPGYQPANGPRLENLDLYRKTNYGKVWDAMFNGLQGNLRYPPFADSQYTTGFSALYAELMAANYPERPQYAALLKEIAGPDFSKGYATAAVYYRDPDLPTKQLPALSFPDFFPPALRIGHMRSGVDGRDSLLTLSASHWGGHHHDDSLNIAYWKQGQELLTDLGYLWDHPDKHMTMRTLAHNTVLIDEAEQRQQERGGTVELTLTSPNVKAMQASSTPHEKATLYNRLTGLVDHGNGQSYVFDVFRVQGGSTQDYVFHGPNSDFQLDGITLQAAPKELYDFKNTRTGSASDWRASWKMNDTTTFTAWALGQPGEQVYIGDGWGQRDSKNADRGKLIPYVVRRGTGDTVKTFVSIFEGYPNGQAIVRQVRRLETNSARPGNAVALEVETTKGRDYIVAAREAEALKVQTADGTLESEGRLAVVSIQNGKVAFSSTEGGAARWNGTTLSGGR